MKRLLWAGALVALLLATAAAVLLTTERGLHWTLDQLGARLEGELTLEGLQGRLLGPLQADRLAYRDGELHVELRQVRLAWRPAALLRARVEVMELHADQVLVALPPPDAGTPQPEERDRPVSLPDIRLPLGVTLGEMDIGDLRIRRGAQRVALGRVRMAAQTRGRTLHLHALEVTAADHRLSVQGRVRPVGRYPLQVEFDWAVRHPEYGPLAGQGRASGDLEQLDLHHGLAQPAAVQLEATVEDLLGELRWRARLQADPFDIAVLNPDWPGLRIAGTATGDGGRDTFQAAIDADIEHPELGTIASSTALRRGHDRWWFDEVRLRLAGTVEELRVQGQWLDQAQRPEPGAEPERFMATGEWTGLRWPAGADPALDSPHGRVHIRGTPERFHIDGDLEARHALTGAFDVRLRGSRQPGRWVLDEGLVAPRAAPSRLALAGTWHDQPIALDGQPPTQFSLRASWQDLQWPLTADAQVTSREGRLATSGLVGAYRFEGQADVAGAQIPPGRWRLAGDGDQNAARFSTITAEILDGGLSGSGTLAWSPELAWQGRLSAEGIDPGIFWPEWSGRLNATAVSQGRLAAEAPLQARLEVSSADSTLRGYPVAADLWLEVDGDSVALQRLELRSGAAQLAARGSLSNAWDLSWTVRVPDLGEVLPEASGRLDADGRLSGPRATPRLVASLQGAQLRRQDLALGRAQAQVDVDMAPAGSSVLRVEGTALRADGLVVDRLAVQGAGTVLEHRIVVELGMPQLQLEASLQGGYTERRWAGHLNRSALTTEQAGHWVQEAPAPLLLAPERVTVSGWCLHGRPGRLCLEEGAWDSEQGTTVAASVAELPLALFQPVLPADLTLSGRLDGQAHLALDSDLEVVTIQARLDADAAVLDFAPGTAQQVTVTFEHIALRAETAGTVLKGTLAADMGEGDFVRAELGLPHLRLRDLADQPYAVSISGRTDSLEAVALLVPELADTRGVVTLALNAEGRGSQLRVDGEAALRDGRAQIPALGLALTDVGLLVTSQQDNILSVQGRAQSGAGAVELTGHIDLTHAEGWSARLRLQGENFQASHLPEAVVVITPDLGITAHPGRVSVDGNLSIPEAAIEPVDLAGAVAPSPDQVFVNGRPTDQPDELRWQVSSRVRVTLGERVTFDGFGLTARVAGSLAVVDEPGRITTATGELQILDGLYEAYGQELAIDRGRLIFTGGPIDDPGLDLRAIRTAQDVIAGVTVRGTLSQPELALFSEPPMDQANALSYLILGRPIAQATAGEGELLYDAAVALGFVGGERLAQAIGGFFGIEEVAIERTPDAAEGPALVLGTYLSPRLYVNYTVGLFEPVNILRIRYQISRRWVLQTETGGPQEGTDLLFTIER